MTRINHDIQDLNISINLTRSPSAHTTSVTWLGSSLITVSQVMILKAVLQFYNAVAVDIYMAISGSLILFNSHISSQLILYSSI
jgi:hypothetical protein